MPLAIEQKGIEQQLFTRHGRQAGCPRGRTEPQPRCLRFCLPYCDWLSAFERLTLQAPDRVGPPKCCIGSPPAAAALRARRGPAQARPRGAPPRRGERGGRARAAHGARGFAALAARWPRLASQGAEVFFLSSASRSRVLPVNFLPGKCNAYRRLSSCRLRLLTATQTCVNSSTVLPGKIRADSSKVSSCRVLPSASEMPSLFCQVQDRVV
jgi:hypothetical protein